MYYLLNSECEYEYKFTDQTNNVLPAQLPGTHWAMICVIRRLAPTVSNVCLKLGCFQSTSTYCALKVPHFMHYINSRLPHTGLTAFESTENQLHTRSPIMIRLFTIFDTSKTMASNLMTKLLDEYQIFQNGQYSHLSNSYSIFVTALFYEFCSRSFSA